MFVLGRNFTNYFNTRYLTAGERSRLRRKELAVGEVDALAQTAAKGDIFARLDAAAEAGIRHLELDAGVPHPFFTFSRQRRDCFRRRARSKGIGLSFHVPCTYVAAAVASPQETDRRLAVALIKKYADIAVSLGCRNLVMHPGSVPAHQATGEYRRMVMESMARSLGELARYAQRRRLVLHLENTAASENIGGEIGECVGLLRNVRRAGVEAKFCFDTGHWLSRFGRDVPAEDGIEEALKAVPAVFLAGGEVHLSDYVPGGKKFHFPLHYQRGVLRKEALVRLFRRFAAQGVGVVVVETVVREAAELLDAEGVLRKEQRYLEEVMNEAFVGGRRG